MENQKIRKMWTKEEDDYLIRRYLKQTVAMSAKKLNRSIPSVKHRAARLGLNHYLDNISVKIVAQCFNVDHSVVKRWVEKYDLPVNKVTNSSRRSIDPVQFWKWAENHKNIINWSKYEEKSLIPEPDWVKEERRNYTTSNARKRISSVEISKVKQMKSKGYTYEKMANELGRSVYSIEHIVRKINGVN